MAKSKSKCTHCGRGIGAAYRGLALCEGCVRACLCGYGMSAREISQPPVQPEFCMIELAERDDGWLRVKWSVSGCPIFKWRFTTGRHAGCYVWYGTTEYQTFAQGYQGLLDEIEKVDLGLKRPPKDDVGFR